MKKFILLLLWSVLSFGQASNEMVSYTQAQSLGFALKAGQSHVTSNQCMTKSEALAKYNLSTSAMASYTDNQLVPRSAWVSAVVYYTYFLREGSGEGVDAICSASQNGVYGYSTSSSIQVPMTFYSNTSLTYALVGNNRKYYYPDGEELLTISNSGELTAISGCSAPRTQITGRYNYPCGNYIYDLWYDGSVGRYYTSEAGSTLYNGDTYDYDGFASPNHVWTNSVITNGILTDIYSVNSTCQPN